MIVKDKRGECRGQKRNTKGEVHGFEFFTYLEHVSALLVRLGQEIERASEKKREREREREIERDREREIEKDRE